MSPSRCFAYYCYRRDGGTVSGHMLTQLISYRVCLATQLDRARELPPACRGYQSIYGTRLAAMVYTVVWNHTATHSSLAGDTRRRRLVSWEMAWRRLV